MGIHCSVGICKHCIIKETCCEYEHANIDYYIGDDSPYAVCANFEREEEDNK